MFLRYVHNFRALAIVIIVACHALNHFSWTAQPRTRDILLDVFDNGTVLFIFVAGFLFEHLSRRYRYRNYLRKKFANVILPYLLISAPAVIYSVIELNPVGEYPELAGTSPGYQVAWFYLKGGASFNYPLWFIPMIALFYLAAPLFIQFVRHPRLYLVLVVLVPLSMLWHRTSELDTLSMALYFLPAYLAGMAASQYRESIEPVLERAWPWLMGAWCCAVLVQFFVASHHGLYGGAYPFSQEHGPIDWMFGQKLLLCFGLLGLLRRFDGVIGDRLKLLGDSAFSIFFLHGYVLFLFVTVHHHSYGDGLPEGDFTRWLLLAAGTLAVSVGITALAKRRLGQRSRYLIGS